MVNLKKQSGSRDEANVKFGKGGVMPQHIGLNASRPIRKTKPPVKRGRHEGRARRYPPKKRPRLMGDQVL